MKGLTSTPRHTSWVLDSIVRLVVCVMLYEAAAWPTPGYKMTTVRRAKTSMVVRLLLLQMPVIYCGHRLRGD